jgi:hypothetical protein
LAGKASIFIDFLLNSSFGSCDSGHPQMKQTKRYLWSPTCMFLYYSRPEGASFVFLMFISSWKHGLVFFYVLLFSFCLIPHPIGRCLVNPTQLSVLFSSQQAHLPRPCFFNRIICVIGCSGYLSWAQVVRQRLGRLGGEYHPLPVGFCL